MTGAPVFGHLRLLGSFIAMGWGGGEECHLRQKVQLI